MYSIFWFLCNLLISFILLCIISFLFNNYFLLIIQFMGILGAFYYSYHFYNKLFIKYIDEIRSLIQDISKVLFFSSIGITLASTRSISFFKKDRKRTYFFCIYILYLMHDFLTIINFFHYMRCALFGLGSTVLFIMFAIAPLETIKSKKLIIIINYITNYSGGIYYLHMKVKELLNNKILMIKNGTLSGCFLIYIICYFISFLGIKLLKTILYFSLLFLFISTKFKNILLKILFLSFDILLLIFIQNSSKDL